MIVHINHIAPSKKAKAAGQKTTPAEIRATLWQQWLARERPGFKPEDYWLAAWGAPNATKLRPESSAATAAANPRLYVDSCIFYENTAIEYVARGAAEFGGRDDPVHEPDLVGAARVDRVGG